MKVRNKTLKESDYKGHFVEAPDKECPCRECFSVHNCYYRLGNKYIDNFECVTNHNKGCPDPKPKPNHFIKIAARYNKLILGEKMLKEGKLYRRCKRCGLTIDVSDADFHNIIADGYITK